MDQMLSLFLPRPQEVLDLTSLKITYDPAFFHVVTLSHLSQCCKLRFNSNPLRPSRAHKSRVKLLYGTLIIMWPIFSFVKHPKIKAPIVSKHNRFVSFTGLYCPLLSLYNRPCNLILSGQQTEVLVDNM